MKTNITLLLAFAIICALLFGYGQYCTGGKKFQEVNVDSLNEAHENTVAQYAIKTIEREREIREMKELRRQDQEVLKQANSLLSKNNEKLKATISENKRLREANDTPGFIASCDTLRIDAYNLSVRADSLQTALAESEETNRALIEMQDAAIQAANDAALKELEFSRRFKAALDTCNARGNAINKSARITGKKVKDAAIIAAAGYIIGKTVEAIIKEK